MVYARELSEAAILDAAKKGRVYLKTRNVNDPKIEFWAASGKDKWWMGDIILISELNDQYVTLYIQYSSPDNQELELIANGERVTVKPKQITTAASEKNTVTAKIKIKNPEIGWVRFNLRDEEGISVISNPIYFR